MEATRTSNRSLPLRVQNPFSLKVAQVFTGFGIGCGVGIGIGRPIYLGKATLPYHPSPAAAGCSRTYVRFLYGDGSVNYAAGLILVRYHRLKKLGLKNIEVGIGCGVGIGHGFGVVNVDFHVTGIALKPGVVNQIQNCFGVLLPAGDLRLENNVLQMKSMFLLIPTYGCILNSINVCPLCKQLLKHQQVIEELIEENQILRQILAEDFKVPWSKLEAKNDNRTKAYYPCSDCFECRRRRRRSAR
ncbi:hypothetical protein B296_00059027 [Ensete ventricosum]|uniref:Uncharacterized protein n=1 Tax=Ensete ventricosum TaxID=4639 RepID=A0A426XJG2_ENSVE|nr:hypothetical protein B296_00059027 [Ensete ventricosum]